MKKYRKKQKNKVSNPQFPIDSKVICLKELMSKKYTVPVYQRPYAWSEEQIDAFLETVFKGYLDHKKKCFFGTMQFNEVDGVLQIVDGQQRLTTINLFLYVLKILSPSSATKQIGIYYKNAPDANTEVSRIFQSPLIETLKKNKRGNYDTSDVSSTFEANTRMLYMKCKDLFSEYQLSSYQDLMDYFIDSLYVVILITKDNEMSLSEIVDIFNTINTTGMDLNGSDVFKIQYFDFLNKKCGKNDVWMERINDSYKLIENYNHDKPQKSHLDMSEVLTIYKHCICAVYKKKYEDLSKSNERFFDDVFHAPDEYMEMLKYDVFHEFVKIYVDLFPKIKANAFCPGTMQTWAYELICQTRYSRYWTLPFIGVCCYWYNNRKIEGFVYDEVIKISYDILKYFIVNSTNYAKVINPVQTKVCNEFLPRLAIFDLKGIRDELSICLWQNPYDSSQNVEKSYSDCLLIDGMNNSRYGISLGCLMLAVDAEVEKHSTDAKIRTLFFENNPYDIEHTYSYAKFSSNPTFSSDEKKKMNGLGNLVLLERHINQDMGRRMILLPQEKNQNKCYDQSDYQVIAEIKNELPNWGPVSVDVWGNKRINRIMILLKV